MVFRIDDITAVSSLPAPPTDNIGTPGYFTGGSLTGQSATLVRYWWLNMVQEELISVVEASGLLPNKSDNSQLLLALKSLFAASATQIPVGVPQPWPTATPPTGWLMCNGAAFSGTQYPVLAAVYTTLKLPDLRGRFLRGWDNGAGIDPGRALLSAQSAAVGSHTHPLGRLWGWSDESKSDSVHPHSGIGQAIYNTTPSTDGDGVLEDVAGGALGIAIGYGQNGSLTSNTAVLANGNNADNRPANVAFNYIVRAS